MKNKKSDLMIKFLTLFFGLLIFVIYIILYKDYMKNEILDTNTLKFIFSWIGNIIYVYIIFSWYRQNGKILDLYTIMVTFLFLFNYGQCFLWSFNIHVDNEIGAANLYGIGKSNDKEIIISQLVSITSIYMFHLGSIFCYRKRKSNSKIDDREIYTKSIYSVSKVLAIIVIPVTFFKSFLELKQSSQYGYLSLYYGEMGQTNIILEMISRLFYPCIFGLMIGRKFDKKINKIVLIIITIYFILSLSSGDRGAWAYVILIFVFLYNTYVRKITVKGTIKLSIVGIILLNIITAVVSVRNTGINIENVTQSLKVENNAIVKTISEMGGSMEIQSMLIRKGYDIYPYGNTHIFAILGIVSDKVIEYLGIDYINLSDWFSQYYLGLENWGAGFSIIGENLINYGPYWTPVVMIIIGYIFTSLIYLDEEDLRTNPRRVLFALISYISLIYIFRGTFAYNLKVYAFRLITFLGLVEIYYLYYKTVQKRRRI